MVQLTTIAQMKTALGLTDSQLTKVTAYLDRVSPKTDDSDPENPVARANTVDDFKDHIVSHYTSLVQSDLKQQIAAPAFD
jgi:hypothetical protein